VFLFSLIIKALSSSSGTIIANLMISNSVLLLSTTFSMNTLFCLKATIAKNTKFWGLTHKNVAQGEMELSIY
jgi:hypothetical protein